MAVKRRTVATFTSGNTMGTVDEPVLRHGVPRGRRGKLWRVKIGVIDGALAASLPFPKEDFDSVIRQLQEFLAKEGLK